MDARYVNYDNDSVDYKVTPIHAPGASTHKSMVYAIQQPITGELMYPPKGRHWKDGQEKLLTILNEWAPYELRVIDDYKKRCDICGGEVPAEIPALMLSVSTEQAKKSATHRYDCFPWPQYFFLSKGLGSIQAKTYLDVSKGKVVSTLWKNDDVGTNVEATNELKPLMNNAPQFDTPKPTRLLERIIKISTESDSIILDSFAGSGTTAHAVLNMNKADGGNRKFILIEMMDYADSITAERVKRVIKGYGEGKSAVPGTGGDFSFYDLGEVLLLLDGNLNESIGVERIRSYVWYTETQEAMPPAPDTDNPYFLGQSKGTGYYFYYEKDAVTTLDHAFLSTIKQSADGYTIYADLCALSDAELAKWNITFKKIPRDIAKL
jgi:adenine-specific DNA-methyltransferase